MPTLSTCLIHVTDKLVIAMGLLQPASTQKAYSIYRLTHNMHTHMRQSLAAVVMAN